MGNWPKKRVKNGHFPIFQPFFPFSPCGAKIHFSAIFSHFGPEARFGSAQGNRDRNLRPGLEGVELRAPPGLDRHQIYGSGGLQIQDRGLNWSWVFWERADFREGDEDSNFSRFSESGGSLNGPELFTELPFL